MRFQPLPPKFHAANRKRLAEAIGPEAIAIIDTADQLVRAGDFEYPYRPDSNFYYLTGISEPEATLILIPGHSDPDLREILIISGTSEFVGAWEGERHTDEEATKLSGIKAVMNQDDSGHFMKRLLEKYHTIYFNADESLDSVMPSPSKRRVAELRTKAPLHELKSALPILAKQRMVKDKAEVEQLQRAIDITATGLTAAWKVTKPGVKEYALEAELGAEYLRAGAQGHAFMAIVASGAATTVIHYMKNDATVGSDELVLFDTGAEVGWYAADISRTVPASGKFTERQRAVYEAVYRTQQAGIAEHKPGASIFSIDEFMRERLQDEIKQLGLKEPLRAYYPHLSHHLGLDVHDTGEARAELKPGMVVTCEPGLYLRDEGIGVRIEDDILITKNGYELLSKNIPSDPDKLEELLS
ncbi:MAG: Peptidase [Candidatus Saccharibacteria bacterium]|jgi:Xaa-Pro aminopeptidase|nr:Peptidase [Candidatus Saccharibacteria bacterium]